MKPQSAKQKGRLLQQWVRDQLLTSQLAINFELEKDDIRSTGMGQGGQDIQMSPKARGAFPFSIECKSLNSVAVYKYFQQAKANMKPGDTPIVVIKQNHSEPLVIISAKDFFEMTFN